MAPGLGIAWLGRDVGVRAGFQSTQPVSALARWAASVSACSNGFEKAHHVGQVGMADDLAGLAQRACRKVFLTGVRAA